MSAEQTEQASHIFLYFAHFYELKEMADQNDGLHTAANSKLIQFWSLYTDQVTSVGKAFTKHTITTKPHKIMRSYRFVSKWIKRRRLPSEIVPRKGSSVLRMTRITKVKLYRSLKLTDGISLLFSNSTGTSKSKLGKQILK